MPEKPLHPAGSQELLRLKNAYMLPCVYHFYKNPPQIVSGEDVWLIDAEGRRYLDCYSGVTVMNAGHSHPDIIEPVVQQVRRLQHTTTIYLTEPVLRLAERLAGILPEPLNRSFFCASGSEAIEGALLLAALHTRRPEIVATTDSLHGRTRWAINATGLAMWRTDPFPLADVHHVAFGDVDTLADVFARRGDRIAAFVAEPIQGNGGIIIPDDGYWSAVRELCTRHGIVLVHDEVQTGMNRTGGWLASSHWGVVPDIVCMSKALGNGFAVAAFVTSDALAASYTKPGASTYGGNPVAAIAALATIDVHESAGLGERSAATGAYFLHRLEVLADTFEPLSRPRGRGLMLGVEVVGVDGAPDAARLDVILEELMVRGFLCGKTGADRNVLTFMPPLTIAKEQVDALTGALEEMLPERM